MVKICQTDSAVHSHFDKVLVSVRFKIIKTEYFGTKPMTSVISLQWHTVAWFPQPPARKPYKHITCFINGCLLHSCSSKSKQHVK